MGLAVAIAGLSAFAGLTGPPALASSAPPERPPELPDMALAQADFTFWLDEVRTEARRRGISDAVIAQALDGLSLRAGVIEDDRNQPEVTITLGDYLSAVVSDWRVEQGAELYREHQSLLRTVAERYGVQPRFLVALWAIESSFGTNMGDRPVIEALATLAWDDRRGAFFRRELFAALEMVDRGVVDVESFRGSWAGAVGQIQFLPSNYLDYAVDQDGSGEADIWASKPDIFASAANFLSEHGWNDDLTWGRAVNVPASLDRNAEGLEVWRDLQAWQDMGVRLPDGGDLPDRNVAAALIAPDGRDGPTYLVYENFQVIMNWNRSHYFGIAVGNLADRIAQRAGIW